MHEAPGAPVLNRFRLSGWFAVLLLAVCARAFALEPSLQPSQYALDNWQIAEGLPQTSVQAIARTPDGYLWVGTQEGLARFDGVRFTVFDTNNESAIPNKNISALFVDRTGRLWIGTRSGIAVLENGHFKPFNSVAGIAHAYVRAITEGRTGRLWVGTESGLFEVGGASAHSFDVSSGLRDSRVRALHEDHERGARTCRSRRCTRTPTARCGWEPEPERCIAAPATTSM
jgi:ligand-binding sensor domain-containing protein